MRRRSLNGEEGVSAVLIVLALTVLLGMVSLSIDGGLLFLKRRALVNANDAASLAAALSCAKSEGQGAADSQADLLAVDNVADATRFAAPAYDPSCDAPSGKVTVNYQADQALFFSQVVGVSSPKVVRSAATATWGGAGGASNVAPLMLSAGRLVDGCEIPPLDPDAQIGQTCSFWWNNSSNANPIDLSSAEWALMNLDKWGAEDGITRFTGSCSNAGFSSYDDWIDDGYPQSLLLDDPPPTYVCRDSGNFGGALNNTIRDAILRGEPLYFPVNNPDLQVDSNGNYCLPQTSCTPDKYAIIGFARLELIALYEGNKPEAQENCPTSWVSDPNARCLVAQWVGYQTGGLIPGGGENFGLVAVTLSG
jgi:hypothetical protein